MVDKNLEILIDKYLDENWEQIVDDITKLVQIPSFVKNDGSSVSAEYPTGKKPVEAMECVLSIAEQMGFQTKNHKNMIGIADYPGKSNKQIGFIGHVDVVAEGFGWNFKPFDVTRRENYLIGRGVMDDKGPTIVALHAINFWIQQHKENGTQFPYSIRYLFGTDEEDNMTDVECYKKDYEEPVIVITPDSDFPICYGEKGVLHCMITTPQIKNGQIEEIWAGDAENVVSGFASAIVQLKEGEILTAEESRFAHAVSIEPIKHHKAQISARGRSTHASTPYGGIDAIAVLANFMLEQNLGNAEEQDFLKLITKIAGKPDGQEIGLDYSDEDLGKLTITTTRLRMKDYHISQVFDIRFPRTTNKEIITKKIAEHLPDNYTLDAGEESSPFVLNPKSKLISALARSYTQATGDFAKIFTMGGATYAREFKCGAGFGAEMPWLPVPAWVGGVHSPNEGVAESTLKKAFKIYVYAIDNLMKLDLSSSNFLEDA